MILDMGRHFGYLSGLMTCSTVWFAAGAVRRGQCLFGCLDAGRVFAPLNKNDMILRETNPLRIGGSR